MRKSSFSKIYTLLFLLLFANNFGQVAISYPTPAEAVTASYSSSYLYVRLDFTQVATAGADATITLPTGFTYVPGSLVQTGTNAGLTIADNGGTPNAPIFKIAPFSIGIGNSLIFKIRRQADCTAISGVNFKDQISVTTSAGTVQDVDPSQNNYTLVYPAISFDQPAEQVDAVPGQIYTRTFTISNGGNGCADKIYFSINYPTSNTTLISLVLAGNTLTPSSISGTTNYYTISGTLLTADQILCNSESLTFTETYRINNCSISPTNYSTGWGPTALPSSSWCATNTGIGTVTMATGTPNFTSFTNTKSGFTDSCNSFIFTTNYTNGGSGNASAATMYNVKFMLGGGANATIQQYYWNYWNMLSATIGGNPITIVNGTSYNIATIDVNNVFTTDPDGAGVGLADIDGDGFYDDLPPGRMATFNIMMRVNCTAYACNQGYYGYYGIDGNVQYTTMCSSVIETGTKITNSGAGLAYGYNSTAIDKSYAPVNILDGVPFNAIVSIGYYFISNVLDNVNTRYKYELTLPPGVSVSGTGNPLWYTGQYPNGISGAGTPVTYSQVGNVLTVTSPDRFMGYFKIDLVYNCALGVGGLVTIPYKYIRLDNIVTGCLACNSEIYCGSFDLKNVICPIPCPAGGPSLTLGKVERADNSLGWTDNTLATHQLRTAISARDLSKALYLDELEVTANGIQNINPSLNLYLKFDIKKIYNNALNKITPIDITLVVKRGATTFPLGTSTIYTTTGGSTNQITEWNLTSLLPAGGLMAGDIIETKSRYNVTSRNLPEHDYQTGNKLYLFNKDVSNNEIYCNSLVPELYLVNPVETDAHNGGVYLTAAACEVKNLGSGTNYYAYRFDSFGSRFLYEVRPGFLPKSYQFTIPPGYEMDHVYNHMIGANITPNTVVGKTYTFNLSPATYPITVTNEYSLILSVFVKPTCSSVASGEIYNSKLTVSPFYYHYKDLAPPSDVIWEKNLNIPYDQDTRPEITIINQSGTIQANQPTESIFVRMTSTGNRTAPYTWLSVPTFAGISAVRLVDIVSTAVILPISYSGGVWFPISTPGLASGTSKDYRLDFTYSNCGTVSFPVEAGWNCLSYPTDPSTYTCGKATVNLSYTTSLAEIQVTEIPQAVSTALCASQNHLFEISNSQASNVKDSTFTLTMPVGYLPVGASFQVEYPRNSGTWQTVTPTISGGTNNIYTFNLTTHSSYPLQGIPGTIYSATADDRFMRVKFQTNTDCDYVPGSKFQYSVAAKGPCGAIANGSNINTYSN